MTAATTETQNASSSFRLVYFSFETTGAKRS